MKNEKARYEKVQKLRKQEKARKQARKQGNNSQCQNKQTNPGILHIWSDNFLHTNIKILLGPLSGPYLWDSIVGRTQI